MSENKTPPKGTPSPFTVAEAPRQLPTIASVYNLLVGCAGQLAGSRTDIDDMRERLEKIEKAGKAAVGGTTQFGKWVLIAGGVLVWSAQIARWLSAKKPELGPLAEALSILSGLVNNGTPPP